MIGGTHARCLFRDPVAKRTGVYLWTITVNGVERPWYVGQTRRGFGDRMAEHIRCFLSGEYPTYDAAALSRGENRLADSAVFPKWPDTLPLFLQNSETLRPNILATIQMLNIHMTAVDGDPHLHNRIEGAIGRHFHAHPELREFFFPGGLRVPAAIPFDQPIRLVISSDAPILGLPSHLAA